MSIIVVASAAPQRYRTTEVEDFQPDFDQSEISPFNRNSQRFNSERQGRDPQSDFDPTDIASFVIRSLASQRNPSGRQGGQGGLLGGSGGGGANLLRILINLVSSELGLSNLDGRSDGIDQEIVIRNLIRTFTNIVGNVLLN